MKNFFITGTDTNVGKTIISAILTYALQKAYWKPVQSGSSDYDYVRKLTNLADDYFFPPQYALKAALSPDQAAAQENMTIDLQSCRLPQTPKGLIIEGAGGIYTPLNAAETLLNLIKQFNLPTVIVSRGTLGTINHTLLTVEVLRSNGITIQGIIFNGELNPDNQAAIEKFGAVRTLFHVPFFQEMNSLSMIDWVNRNHKIIKECFL